MLSPTYDSIFVSIFQLCDGHKVTVHCGDALIVITWHDGGVSVEGHLVVVLQRGVLFVGRLECSLGDVVHLPRTLDQSC